jgi:hypothetical protein
LLDYTRDNYRIYSEALADAADLDGWLLRTGFVFDVINPNGTRLYLGGEYQDGQEDHHSAGGVYRRYDQQQREWFSLHVRTAVESPVTSWLTVRASVQYRRIQDTVLLLWPNGEPQDVGSWEKHTTVDVDTPIGVGVTAAWGQFRLDAAYNDTAPLSVANIPDANAVREQANFATVSLRFLY